MGDLIPRLKPGENEKWICIGFILSVLLGVMLTNKLKLIGH